MDGAVHLNASPTGEGPGDTDTPAQHDDEADVGFEGAWTSNDDHQAGSEMADEGPDVNT